MPSKQVSNPARIDEQPKCTDDRGIFDTMLWDRTECISNNKNQSYKVFKHEFLEYQCKECDYRTGNSQEMYKHAGQWDGACPIPPATEQEFEEMRITLLNRVRDGN